MAHWRERTWFHWTMLASGVLLWIANLWQMIRGFAHMDFIQAASAGMIFFILPPLLWRDWNRRKGVA